MAYLMATITRLECRRKRGGNEEKCRKSDISITRQASSTYVTEETDTSGPVSYLACLTYGKQFNGGALRRTQLPIRLLLGSAWVALATPSLASCLVF